MWAKKVGVQPRKVAAIGHTAPMIDLLGLLLATLGSRQRLHFENLLLRQQLQVARPCSQRLKPQGLF